MAIENVTFEPGYITLTRTGNRSTRITIANVLRALDIPTGLTYSQVGAISTLANLVVVLVRTLIAKDVLDEQFLEDGEYDLNIIIQAIEDMGGDYTVPDLNVT